MLFPVIGYISGEPLCLILWFVLNQSTEIAKAPMAAADPEPMHVEARGDGAAAAAEPSPVRFEIRKWNAVSM